MRRMVFFFALFLMLLSVAVSAKDFSFHQFIMETVEIFDISEEPDITEG